MECLHARVLSLPFFKTKLRISRTVFSENTSIKLLLFFTEDGPAYGRKIMTGYVRQKQKHNVAIAEKRVDRFIYDISTIQSTKKNINNESSKSDPIQSRLFWS